MGRSAAAALWWPELEAPRTASSRRVAACGKKIRNQPRIPKGLRGALVALLLASCASSVGGIDGRQPSSCAVIQTASGKHVPRCVEPARQPDSSCISTEVSTCSKTCTAGVEFDEHVECTGFCRCEPVGCDASCEATCCKLIFDRTPSMCTVDQWDCTYRQTFLELSSCLKGVCACEAGYCGMAVSEEGEISCEDGAGAPCIPCPRGTYKVERGLSACAPCPEGFITPREGSTSIDSCVRKCPPGSSSANGFEPCEPCDWAFYQPMNGSVACDACPPGSNTSFIGTTLQEDCCIACDVDFRAAGGSTVWAARRVKWRGGAVAHRVLFAAFAAAAVFAVSL